MTESGSRTDAVTDELPEQPTDGLSDLKRDYRAAFLRYLGLRDEAALHDAYLLGRASLAQSVTTLDLARIHHEVLLDALRETHADDLGRAAERAAEVLLQVLAVYEMSTGRAAPEGTSSVA